MRNIFTSKRILAAAALSSILLIPLSATFAQIRSSENTEQLTNLRGGRKSAPPSVNGMVTTFVLSEDLSAYTTSATFSHTVNGGKNQILVVTSGTPGGGLDTSATYGGVPMRLGRAQGSDGFVYHDYWYLVNPPTGTHDLVINFPLSGGRHYAAITISNVDTKKPFDPDAHVGSSNFGPNDSQSATLSVSTSVPNELVLSFIEYGGSNATYVSNYPPIFEMRTGYGNIGATRVQYVPGTVTVGGVVSRNGGGSVWEIVAIPIRPAR